MSSYRVLVGLDYPPGKRAEAGDVVSDLPEKSIKWLLSQNKIEPTDSAQSDPAPKKKSGGKK
jgi:hypothetical protein